MGIFVNDMPLFGPVEQIGNFGLYAAAFLGSPVKHDGCIFFPPDSDGARILFPWLSVNLDGQLFSCLDCYLTALTQ